MDEIFMNTPINKSEPDEPAVTQEVQEENSAEFNEAEIKFKNDATACMQKICAAMKKLDDLAGKKGMVYTEEDIDKIFTYLSAKLDKSKAKFMDRIEEQKGFNFTF